MRAQPKLYDAARALPATSPSQPLQDSLHRWFAPRREERLMAEQKASGLFIPYPLLTIMMTLVLALGGGMVGLFVQVNSLSTTILLRDADYQRERQQAWEKIQELQVWIQNDRERLIKLEEHDRNRNGRAN